VGGGNPVPPTFTYFLGGIAKSVALSQAVNLITADAGSSWAVTPNPLSNSNGAERWVSNQTLTGTASNASLVFVFYHQYYLTTQAEPSVGGSVFPASNWFDAGLSIPLTATAKTGFIFAGWAGVGSGSYSETKSTAILTMNGPITETAHFEQAANVMIKSQGGAQFIVVDNNTVGINDTTPYVPDWVVNSTHVIVALSNASCGFRLGPFSGCVYVFKEWIVNGTTKTADTINVNLSGKPITIVGVWTQSYLNLEIALSLAAAVIIATLFLRRRRHANARTTNLCYRCGYVNPKENSFCGRCGVSLRDATRMY
jgi:hypothetical protein